tara:strand:+ start:1147 stop:1317 length:171 start_codon:yes stop_codon:yes gene_type:complete
MGILDLYYKNGKQKSAKGIAKAIHWVTIQNELRELTFQEFKEVVFPIIQEWTEKED